MRNLHFDDHTEAGLAEALAHVPWVLLAYVFGSRAQGRARPDSDLDLGFVIAREVEFEVYTTLADACSPWFPADKLHLVILNESPPLLRHRVVSEGRCLLARSPEERVAWEVQTMREYWDTERWRALDAPGAKLARAADRSDFFKQIGRAGEVLRG